MGVSIENYQQIKDHLGGKAKLVAVSKVRTVDEIKLLYDLGQRDFGENYVQEMVAKHLALPGDIRWHFIGHLQSNKVKNIAPFVHLIQGVDSFKLLEEIDRQAILQERTINCLMQVHIAQEETKFGLSHEELKELIGSLPKYKLVNKLTRIKLCGLMGMASLTDDNELIRKEFKYLKCIFDDMKAEIKQPFFKVLSMGMSSDYAIAMEEGSTMVRIGSLLFGERVANRQ